MFDVIVPIYNIPAMKLRQCLESIVSQSFEEWNCYIIECPSDSSEESKKILKDCLKDNRFHYIEQTSQGLSAARNEAIEMGNSPFVSFLDGDDRWFKDHLFNINEEIVSSDSCYGFWWDYAVYPMPVRSLKSQRISNVWLQWSSYDNIESFRPEDLHYYLMVRTVYPSTLVVRRVDGSKVNWFDNSINGAEDVDFLMRLTKVSFGSLVKEEGAVHHPSMDGTKTWDFTIVDTGSHANPLIKELIKRYPWPTRKDRPDNVSESYWESLMDFMDTKDKHTYEGEVISHD